MAKHLQLPTILVIADHPTVRFWLKKQLDDRFFIIEAQTEQQAIESVQNSALDLILLDSTFEDCDALKLCKKIRGSLSNTITPIFLITGRLKKTYLDQAHEAGVTDFLSDQLDIEELEERIASGKKVTSMREKTEEASSALQVSKKEISKAYFKNKLLLHDHALRMLAAAKIENIPVILLFLRIDRFEEIQKDAFLAESILAELSELIVSQLSDFDLLIPYSEGQFILLLPNVLSERARHIAEHLRKEVARNRFETKKGPLYLTLSIAISSLEASEKAFQAMIETALKAFKQAKLATNLILSLDLERP